MYCMSLSTRYGLHSTQQSQHGPLMESIQWGNTSAGDEEEMDYLFCESCQAQLSWPAMMMLPVDCAPAGETPRFDCQL